MNQSKFPIGWDAARVQKLIDHYEQQTELEAVAEDEAALREEGTTMQVPAELVPLVRELIAKSKA
ncbi:MAG: hypothetical protein FJW38_00730 [Acidobacteria bacterium]|nr:hypothetical protein [Acidobacteriota bacterium]